MGLHQDHYGRLNENCGKHNSLHQVPQVCGTECHHVGVNAVPDVDPEDILVEVQHRVIAQVLVAPEAELAIPLTQKVLDAVVFTLHVVAVEAGLPVTEPSCILTLLLTTRRKNQKGGWHGRSHCICIYIYIYVYIRAGNRQSVLVNIATACIAKMDTCDEGHWICNVKPIISMEKPIFA